MHKTICTYSNALTLKPGLSDNLYLKLINCGVAN